MAVASQVVGKVAADIQPLKKGYAEAKTETSNLASHFKSSLGNLFSTAGGMLASAGISLGISTIIGGLKGWVDGAIQAQQNQAALNAVLKSTHDAVGMSAAQINTMVQSLKNLTGVDDDVIMQGTNMLLTFTNIGSSVFPQANQAMLDMAVAMNHGSLAGLDLKDTSIQLGKALNDPIAGISALSRVGVTFTEDQKKQIKAMVDAGNTAGAQKLILNELAREFGGAAKAAGDADPFNRWNLAIGDLGKTVGALVLPMLTGLVNLVTPLAQWVGDHLPGAFDNLKTAMKPVGDILGVVWDMAKNLWDVLVYDLQPSFDAISGIVKNLTPNFSGFSVSLDDVYNVMGQVNTVLEGFFLNLQDVFLLIVNQGKHSFDQMKSDWMPIIQQFAGWFTNDLQPAIQKIMPSVQGFLDVLITKGVPAFFAVRDAAAHLVAIAVSSLLPIWEKLTSVLVPLIGYVFDLGKKALAYLLPQVQSAAKEISKFADEMKTRLQPFIENITKAIQAASDIIRKVWGMLWPWISSIIGIAWDLIKANIAIIWGGIQLAFRIGADIVTGKWGKIWDDIKGTLSGVWDKLKGILGDLWQHIQDAFQAASGIVSKAWHDWIIQPLTDAFNGIIQTFEGLWQSFLDFVTGTAPTTGAVGHKGSHGGRGMGGYAEGGTMPFSGMAWVGEQKPELVFGPRLVPMLAGTRIMNGQDTQAALSAQQPMGNTYNYTTNLYGQTSEELLKQARMDQQRRAAYYGR